MELIMNQTNHLFEKKEKTMDTSVRLVTSERKGNLHISIEGICSAETSLSLITALRQSYRGAGNIFIHTSAVVGVADDYRGIDQETLNRAGLNTNHIYLIGSMAMNLNIACNKIIIPPARKKRCTGNGGCGCGRIQRARQGVSSLR